MAALYKSVNGMFYTKALFKEYSQQTLSEIDPVFTLQVERPGFICARTTFLAEGDPTGYKWAMKYLGDWHHWKKLMNCPWFREAYDVWMEEFKASLRAEALDNIRAIASGGSSQALAAAKYLATYDWEKATKGRPSKAEIAGELKRQVRMMEEQDEDAERIGLKTVPNSKTS